jgi:proteasome inhibitor subunit 1 (PI31)
MSRHAFKIKMADDPSVDVIYKTAVEGSNVKIQRDLIVLALHASFLSNGFDCINVKDEGFETDWRSVATPTSPALPEGWNESPDVYTLQYYQKKYKDRICLIKILPLGELLLINSLTSDDQSNIHSLSLPLSQYTSNDDNATSPLKNIIQLFNLINKEIIDKVQIVNTAKEDNKGKTSGSSKSSLADGRRREDVLMGPPHYHQPSRLIDQRGNVNPATDPFRLGAGDLSPFGGPGGGMLMDPFRGGRYGGGPSIGGPRPSPMFMPPPGARFDPVMPYGVPSRPHPPPPNTRRPPYG